MLSLISFTQSKSTTNKQIATNISLSSINNERFVSFLSFDANNTSHSNTTHRNRNRMSFSSLNNIYIVATGLPLISALGFTSQSPTPPACLSNKWARLCESVDTTLDGWWKRSWRTSRKVEWHRLMHCNVDWKKKFDWFEKKERLKASAVDRHHRGCVFAIERYRSAKRSLNVQFLSSHTKRFYKYVHWMQTVENMFLSLLKWFMWIVQMQLNRFESDRSLFIFYILIFFFIFIFIFFIFLFFYF